MADVWYYRFMDQEMGPVDLATLQSLAADGALSTTDEVRCGTEEDWRPAESVEGLFPEAADAGDLLGMLQSEAQAPAVPSTREARGADCFCRLLGVEVGPMTFEQLAALAAAGRLNPQDQVRLNAQADWIEAGSIVGLFTVSDAQSQVSDDVPPSIGVQPLLDSHELEPAPAAEAPTESADDGNRVWYCKLLGHEIGPVTFEDVHAMVAAGQLMRTDELRHGRRGDWVPADSIVGLFPEEEAPADEDQPEADAPEAEAEDDDGYKFDFADFVGDEPATADQRKTARSRKPQKKTGRGTRTRRDDARSRPTVPGSGKSDGAQGAREKVTPPPQVPVSPPPPRPAPISPASMPPSASAAAAVSSAPPAKPVPVAVPKPRRSFGNPFAGVGSAVGGLFRSAGGLFSSLRGRGGLSQHWKPLAAAVVLGAIAYLIYFGSPFGSSRGPEVYRETLTIWDEANRLKESPGEWSGFKEKTMPRVEQLKQELVEEASSSDRLLQLMLYCHRDCLPQILQGTPDSSQAKWDEMHDYMEEARRLAAK